MDLQKNFIDGRWSGSASGRTYERRNPATGDVIAVSTRSTAADVAAAVAAAKQAFRSWRLVPAPKRGELLFSAARLLEARKEQLAREMTEEMGKFIDEARGDVQKAIERFNLQCDALPPGLKRNRHSGRRLRRTRC